MSSYVDECVGTTAQPRIALTFRQLVTRVPAEMNMDFKVADPVRVKTGGPRMIIESFTEDGLSANCTWHESGKGYQSKTFPLAILEKAERPRLDQLPKFYKTGGRRSRR